MEVKMAKTWPFQSKVLSEVWKTLFRKRVSGLYMQKYWFPLYLFVEHGVRLSKTASRREKTWRNSLRMGHTKSWRTWDYWDDSFCFFKIQYSWNIK
jgi:hypothetical protein